MRVKTRRAQETDERDERLEREREEIREKRKTKEDEDEHRKGGSKLATHGSCSEDVEDESRRLRQSVVREMKNEGKKTNEKGPKLKS